MEKKERREKRKNKIKERKKERMRRQRCTGAPMIKLLLPPKRYRRDESVDTMESQLWSLW
jgi:hypothetical protein